MEKISKSASSATKYIVLSNKLHATVPSSHDIWLCSLIRSPSPLCGGALFMLFASCLFTLFLLLN